ncbi:hypothetical protein RHMOL_Rhmol09G0004800 [Rhododendron molle]|uniref:Uncharacterized protein n=1 Tax=Rhododendron molle TaxID=49168 RepID=A0ACC0M8E8_RHOML|nr:hypothetical protein RHMOL_Rhmol09G0004800 [Rhododendron molle]
MLSCVRFLTFSSNEFENTWSWKYSGTLSAHLSFCGVIPSSCIQMRNIILSAFPHNMKVPDPFTPTLKIDLLPGIKKPPRSLEVEAALTAKQMKSDTDEYLKVD